MALVRLETETRLSAQMRLAEQRRIVLEEPNWFSAKEKTLIFDQSMISTETHRARRPLKLSRTAILFEKIRLPWFPKRFLQEGDLSHRAPTH